MGALMLLLGSAALVIAPLEMICFTWFSGGGRFGYEIRLWVLHIRQPGDPDLSYYVIALLAIPIGAYHWMLRRSIRPVMLALLRIWWILGIPLLLVFLFVLLASKTLTLGVAVVAFALALLSYTVLPAILGRFYRSRAWARCWSAIILARPERMSWAFRCSPLLGWLFSGFWGSRAPLVPWSLSDTHRVDHRVSGLALIDGAILTLLLLLWGVMRQRRWAAWGRSSSLAFDCALGWDAMHIVA